MSTTFKTLNHFIDSKAYLGDLRRQIQDQTQLLSAVKRALPSLPAEHCQAALLHQQLLILFTDSPAWASRLRFLVPRIVDAFGAQDIPIKNVSLRILQQPRTPKKPRSHTRLMSEDNSRLLQETAKTLPNKGLAEALVRLSRHKK